MEKTAEDPMRLNHAPCGRRGIERGGQIDVGPGIGRATRPAVCGNRRLALGAQLDGDADEVLRKKVEAAISSDGWAICGNYAKLRESIWPRADTLIWLDYPMGLAMWRVLRRTIRRSITGEPLWSNNVETWQKSFLSSDSIIVWTWTSWRKQRRMYSAFFRSREYPGLRRYRFVSPARTRQWLDEFVG